VALPNSGAESLTIQASDFRGGRASFKQTLTKDYETGPTGLNDTSEGLLVKTWVFEIRGSTIVTYPEATPSLTTTLGSGYGELTEISGTFDQNGRPIFTYVEDGEAKLNWYDSSIASFTVTNYGATVLNPRVALDDKRFSQNPASDIIFTYIKNTNLYYRTQRERYLTEHLFKASVIQNENTILFRVGLNRGYRFQWEFRDYTVSDDFEFEITNENFEAFLDLASDDASQRADINDNSSTATDFDEDAPTVWDADNKTDEE
jgi:hypothetical protein